MQVDERTGNEIVEYVKKIMNNFTFEQHKDEGYFPFILSTFIYERCLINFLEKGDFIMDGEELNELVELAKQNNLDFYLFCFQNKLSIINISKDIYNINFKENEKEPNIRNI